MVIVEGNVWIDGESQRTTVSNFGDFVLIKSITVQVPGVRERQWSVVREAEEDYLINAI
ncbi:hypothetical protein J6590_104518, partial [Homalodisca vitripennis]